MTSLAESLPEAIRHASKWRDQLLETAAIMGPSGDGCRFSAAITNGFINEAVNALASGDVARMLRAYENVKGYEDAD